MKLEKATSAQIRAARALLGLSQDELAEMSGVTRKTLAGIESQEGRPFTSTMAKVVNALRGEGVEFVNSANGYGVVLNIHPHDPGPTPS